MVRLLKIIIYFWIQQRFNPNFIYYGTYLPAFTFCKLSYIFLYLQVSLNSVSQEKVTKLIEKVKACCKGEYYFYMYLNINCLNAQKVFLYSGMKKKRCKDWKIKNKNIFFIIGQVFCTASNLEKIKILC